jgi:hypothetical protein
MRTFLKTICGEGKQGRGHSASSPGKRRARLGVEALEARDLMSAMPFHHFLHSGAAHAPGPNGVINPNPIGGLTPGQVRHAYGFDAISFRVNGQSIVGDGSGQTIALVDAYDAPNIASDLHVFDSQFGLPDPPSFRKIDQNGGINYPSMNTDWAGEISLDVEWAHAIAPRANILLVEANDNNYGNLFAAVDQARRQSGVVVVSMSWGGGEFSGETGYDSHLLTPSRHTGGSGLAGEVAFVASSGDSGQPAQYPATSPTVLAVGGTTLSVDASGNYLGESGWSGSGGGLSSQEGQPAYQAGLVPSSFSKRGSPDVAYNANTGVAIYDSTAGIGWETARGTSAGAPQWAALVAIVDQGRALYGSGSLGTPALLQALYGRSEARARDFHDITSGNNGYAAGPGYDLVTGLGSPRAAQVVADMPIPAPVTQPSSWSSLGGHSLQQIALGRNLDGRMEMFAVGGDFAVYDNTQVTLGGAWGGWHYLGGYVKSITVAREQDGRLDVFALGTDRAVYYVSQVAANSDTWGSWKTIGGVALDFVVGTHSNGALEIFEIGTNHQVYKNWENAPNGSFQSGFSSSLGGNARAIYVANNLDQSLQLFTINQDGSVSTAWQTNNGPWSSWQSLYGAAIHQLAITNNNDGRLEIFAIGGDNAVYYQWETTPNLPSSWSGWYLLGGFNIQQVTAGRRSDGRIQLEVLGGDSAVYQTTQSVPNGGWPGSWSYLGGSMQQLVQATYADNTLHLFGLSRDDVAFAYTGTLTNSPTPSSPTLLTSRSSVDVTSGSPASAPHTRTATSTTAPTAPADLVPLGSDALFTELVRQALRTFAVRPELFADLDPMPPEALMALSLR